MTRRRRRPRVVGDEVMPLRQRRAVLLIPRRLLAVSLPLVGHGAVPRRWTLTRTHQRQKTNRLQRRGRCVARQVTRVVDKSDGFGVRVLACAWRVSVMFRLCSSFALLVSCVCD